MTEIARIRTRPHEREGAEHEHRDYTVENGDMTVATRWFVLRVPNRKAQDIIDRIGPLYCWRPTYSRLTRPRNKHKPVPIETALIPGWVFVMEEAHSIAQGIEEAYGTLKYGRLGTLWIGDEELNGLRSACDTPPEAPQGGSQLDNAPPPIGTKVKLRGLLYGRSGVVRAYDIHGNAVVDLGDLNITVNLRLVEAA